MKERASQVDITWNKTSFAKKCKKTKLDFLHFSMRGKHTKIQGLWCLSNGKNQILMILMLFSHTHKKN